MLELTLRDDAPVDDRIQSAIAEVHLAAKCLGQPYMMVGAMARDLVLHHVYGQTVSRRTRDIDIAVYVRDWQAFAELRSQLALTQKFDLNATTQQRIYWLPDRLPIDLLPFGGITSPESTIAWPPEHDVVMSVLGFEDALAAAVQVKLSIGISISVASLPGLAVLKLLAWQARRKDRDASDLYLLVRNYSKCGQLDRIYDVEYALVEAYDLDPELAGAHLLGKDAAQIARSAAASALMMTISDSVKISNLVDAIYRGNPGASMNDSARDPALWIQAFARGFKGLP